MFIDSHAHLTTVDYEPDRALVIKKAQQSGVRYILNVAFDLETLTKAHLLVNQYSFIYLAAGIHPHQAAEEDYPGFISLLNHPKLVAIGEIGLDFYRNYAPREKQIEVFRLFLREAKKRRLPVIIHQRAAQDCLLDIVKQELDQPVSGVMHCFSGERNWAEQCLEAGFLISFAGNITYPKAAGLREVAKQIPLARLLIETDCPWLAPQPIRGRRNEPAEVRYVAEQIAQIKGIPVEKLGEIVTANFERLFLTGK